MVIFEGVTLIYLYNVPLRPHGVYCQHEPQWGNIFSDEQFTTTTTGNEAVRARWQYLPLLGPVARMTVGGFWQTY